MKNLNDLLKAIKKQENLVSKLRNTSNEDLTITTPYEWSIANAILTALNSSLEKVKKEQESINKINN